MNFPPFLKEKKKKKKKNTEAFQITPPWQGLASAPLHRILSFELQGMSWSLQKIRYSLVCSQKTSPLFPISQLHCWGNCSKCQPREGEEREIGCPGRRLGEHVAPRPATAALAGPRAHSAAWAAGAEMVWYQLGSAPCNTPVRLML